MIKQLKFSMKMIRYGYGILLNCVAGILFGILGILYLVWGFIPLPGHPANMLFYLGGILVSLSGSYIVQIWMSFNSAGLVLSSPRNKAFLCTIPTLMFSISATVGFTFSLLFGLIMLRFYPAAKPNLITGIYLLALCILLTQFFFAFCYRYFLVSIILFFAVFPALLASGHGVLFLLWQKDPDSVLFTLPVSILIGYCILAVGILFLHRVSLLLYRKPVSKWAQGASLRRYL